MRPAYFRLTPHRPSPAAPADTSLAFSFRVARRIASHAHPRAYRTMTPAPAWRMSSHAGHLPVASGFTPSMGGFLNTKKPNRSGQALSLFGLSCSCRPVSRVLNTGLPRQCSERERRARRRTGTVKSAIGLHFPSSLRISRRIAKDFAAICRRVLAPFRVTQAQRQYITHLAGPVKKSGTLQAGRCLSPP